MHHSQFRRRSIGFGDGLDAAARPEEIGGAGAGTDVVGADSGAENVVVLNHIDCVIEAGLRDGSGCVRCCRGEAMRARR